jgi:hypothetical protein
MASRSLIASGVCEPMSYAYSSPHSFSITTTFLNRQAPSLFGLVWHLCLMVPPIALIMSCDKCPVCKTALKSVAIREEAIKLAGTVKEDMLQCFVIKMEKTEGGHHQAISQKHADLVETSVKVNAVSHGFCHDSQANDLCQKICIVAETKPCR